MVDHKFFNILLKPFYWLGALAQRWLFTSKPQTKHIEVAIACLKHWRSWRSFIIKKLHQIRTPKKLMRRLPTPALELFSMPQISPPGNYFSRRNTSAMFVPPDFSEDRTCKKQFYLSKLITPGAFIIHLVLIRAGVTRRGSQDDPAVPACMLRYPVPFVSVGIPLGVRFPDRLGSDYWYSTRFPSSDKCSVLKIKTPRGRIPGGYYSALRKGFVIRGYR